MNCRRNMRFRLIYAIDGVLILAPLGKNVKEQVECSFFSP